MYNAKYNEALDKAEAMYSSDTFFAKFIQDRRTKREMAQKAAEEEARQKAEARRKKMRNNSLLFILPFAISSIAVFCEYLALEWTEEKWGWLVGTFIWTYTVFFILLYFTLPFISNKSLKILPFLLSASAVALEWLLLDDWEFGWPVVVSIPTVAFIFYLSRLYKRFFCE